MNVCDRCNRSFKSSRDIEHLFCNRCCKDIDDMCRNRFSRVTALVDGIGRSQMGDDKSLMMYGFLSIFHPDLSHDKKMQLVRIEDI